MRRTKYDWFGLIVGIAMIALGVFSLIRPGALVNGFTVLYAAIAIITGLADLIFYCRMEKYVGFGPAISLTCGVVSLMVGIMLLLHPTAGQWLLCLLVPLWFIAHSIFRLTSLERIRFWHGDGRYYFTMVVSIIGLILGCIMIFEPMFTIRTAGIIVGVYLIIHGVNTVALAGRRDF